MSSPPPPTAMMVVEDILAKLRPEKRAAADTRTAAGRHRQQLAGLTRFALAEDLAPCAVVVAEYFGRFGVDAAAKQASHYGYDVVRNRVVDYGNVVYKTVLQGFALEQAVVHEALTRAAEKNMPTLNVGYADTPDSLSNQGDLIEILLGVARGDDFQDMRRAHSADQWRELFVELTQLCRSLAYLRCLLHGGTLPHSLVQVDKIVKGDVPDTCAFLAQVALNLFKRL